VQEVEKQCQCAGNCGCGTQPVKALNDLAASSVSCNSFVSSLKRKDQSDTTISSRGVASSNDLAVGQSSSSVITLVHSSANESAGCCGSPRSEVALVGVDSEAVLSNEVQGSLPANGEALEGIVQTDVFVSVNNLGFDYKNPEQEVESNAVCCEPSGVIEVVGGQEAESNQDLCCKNQTKVNPTASGSVDVFSGHVSQTTPSAQEELVALVSQEGK
jgi:hypothetical protein